MEECKPSLLTRLCPRISPQFLFFPKPRPAVSCARRGGAVSPASAGIELKGWRFSHGIGCRSEIEDGDSPRPARKPPGLVRSISASSAGTDSRSPFGLHRRRGGGFRETIDNENNDILYKFTGFLDKFLKTDGAGTKITILFISVVYNRIINRKSNFFQEFIEIKRFFATPHFPATARICAPERGRRHRPGRDAPAGPAAEIPPASGGGFFVSPATWYIRGTPPPHRETRRAWRRIPRISRKYP